jgi:Uncharacterized alpha/beta hydrolase domain (DUF2235)
MRALFTAPHIGRLPSKSNSFFGIACRSVFLGDILSPSSFVHSGRRSITMAASQDSGKASKIRKRIIVACDGTWQDADSDYERIYPWKFWRRECYLMPASNVARLCRCISKEGVDANGQPVPQLVFYQAGVGTSWMQRLTGGLTGKGVTSNIRDAYSFICNNYEEGDEVFLFGFSRGAFTARSISTLLRTIGILNESGLAHFYSISEDWKHQNEKDWPSKKTRFIDDPWGSANEPRPSPQIVEDGKVPYVEKLREYGFLRCDEAPIGIKVCGVWDTVGYVGKKPPNSDKRLTKDIDLLVCLRYGFLLIQSQRNMLLSTPTSSRTLNMPFKL